MRLLILCCLVVTTSTLFFPTSGGGGGGCCCGCGTPQPASCGCGPVCPPPQPCPSCPAPPPCPPPPTAICPQVQPIYIPACSGGGCGGGYSSGGCGGGGGSCGGGYAVSNGGGYATSGGGYATSGGGGYSSAGGGGYAAPQVAPASGYASSGSSASFSAPVANEAGYSSGGTGYQQHVVAAQADDPKGAESGPIPPAPQAAAVPNLNQAFHSPQICEPQKIKYVVLRAKKLHGRPGEGTLEEEAEEIERPSSLEATASPLDAKEVGDELLHGDEDIGDAEGGIQARGAPTLSDAKCNSKPLRDLIMENIVRDDALSSKRQIHEASIKRFPEHTVDVICSTTGFTYLVSTTEHCEAQRDNVICFVYKRPI